MRIGRVDPLAALMQGTRGVTAGSTRSVMRHGFVAAQVAMAATLLVGAVLLLQSFVRLQHVPLGFDPDGVWTARIGLPRATYPDASRVLTFYERLLQSMEGSPDVQVAVATSAPFAPGVRAGARITLPRRDGNAEGAESRRTAVEHIVSDNYFRTLAIPIVAGRAFDRRDRPGLFPVAIVSQSTARQLWSDANPVGQQLERNGTLHEVVGVVGDVRGASDQGARGGGLDRQPRPAIYVSAAQFPQASMTVLLRTTREPSALVPALRAAVRDINSAASIDQGRPLDEWLTEAAAQPRLTTTLAGTFAAAALLLVIVGIYGVVAYAVGQRTQEIGLRMAVGATRGRILALMVRAGMTPTIVGLTLGLAGALLLSQVLATLLFEVRPGVLDVLSCGSSAPDSCIGGVLRTRAPSSPRRSARGPSLE